MRPDGRRGLAAVLALTCAAGCATAPARAPQPASDDGLAGWQALADG
jgi:hypothetical protein